MYYIPFENRFLIYNPLQKVAFVGNEAIVKIIQNFSNKKKIRKKDIPVMDFLNSIHFFNNDFNQPFPKHESGFVADTLVLCLTTKCNFNCIYCYAHSDIISDNPRIIDLQMAKDAILYINTEIIKRGIDSFNLNYHGGGEPTYAWSELTSLTIYAKELNPNVKISLTSNGYWSKNQRDWIINNINDISFSFDGMEMVQNYQRPTKSGKPTYNKVFNNLLALDKANFSYGIRLTVTDKTINLMEENIDFLCKNTNCRTFQIEPAFGHGKAKTSGNELFDYENFEKAFLKCYDIAESYNRHYYYSGARPWIITDSFCKAPNTAMILTTDGFLTNCYEIFNEQHSLFKSFFIGSFDMGNGINIDENARHKFAEKIKERRKSCESCFCFYHCAGDCPAKIFDEEGEIKNTDTRCELNKNITKNLILRYIEKGGGIYKG